MSPRGKAKPKKDLEENGREKHVRESRNIKATYKDLSDSEDEKPARRRKKVSDSDASVSEEEKPKKRVVKGRKAPARAKKQESESEEASDFNSDESSGEESNKRRKTARKPTRSLRTPQRASYKDLSDSEDVSEESFSEKEEKKTTEKRKRGRPAKSDKKMKKQESSESEEDDIKEEEEEEEEKDQDDDSEDADDKPSKASLKKRKVDPQASVDSDKKQKEESEGKSGKQDRPEHDISEEDDEKEEDKAKVKETETKPEDSKKRGRPPKNVESKEVKDEEEPPAKKAKAGEKPALNKTESDYASIDFSSEAKTKDGKEWNFKISSWNVAGLKAWIKKNGLDFLKHENPDVLCLQETKCSEKKLPPEAKFDGYHTYWLSGEKEGYAGVAILSKTKPLDVKYGIEKPEFDNDGRVITAEFEKFFLVNVYVPNAGQGLKTLPRRLEWDPAFRAYLKSLDEKKPVILCGDLNVAHNEIDLANPKTNTKSAGFTPQEREGMTQLLKEGFVDSFRNLYPDKTGAYSFWTYMSNARSRNVGWRLDYFITSERFVPQICDNVIRSEVYGSDHCPITLFAHL